MAEAKQYWMVPRPHRKPHRVPLNLQTFSSVALGKQWRGNRATQIAFENALDNRGLKISGDYSERAVGRGGSGGRTHAALLYALGLYFTYPTETNSDTVFLTLAGEDLVNHKPALPVLTNQILSFQYPSPYSVNRNVNIDRRFKLRPFVFLLKLLLHPSINGHLTATEIATCVLCFAEKHNDKAVSEIAEKILNFRSEQKVPSSLAETANLSKPSDKIVLQGQTLGDIADTIMQWLLYTGLVVKDDTRTNSTISSGTTVKLDPPKIDQVREHIEHFGKLPLVSVFDDQINKKEKSKALASFQRTFGRGPFHSRDNRRISEIQDSAKQLSDLAIISAAVTTLFPDRLITEPTEELVTIIHNQTGQPESFIEAALIQLFPNKQKVLSDFLLRYHDMAFSGTDNAILFEKTTASIFHDIFGFHTQHVGQQGKKPDVLFSDESFEGIIDTKAYSSYSLESDHQLRMQTNYIPSTPNAQVFIYIAGGFSPSFGAHLRTIVEATNVHGCGIGIQALIRLIRGYPSSGRTRSDLISLWQSDRELTMPDIVSFLDSKSSIYLRP
ncbi:AlwI family type II restriction endonuclease [Arcanobacterium phocae]|uniref:AlwI family type II restriction endonuclease n=1 Tax=Arcanobacterium phocae TaxID=131112 RepID=UPI001C0EDE7D|nr:AlwI family type II restriction endonuclease [Arcanobacterium phocae]